MLLPKTDCEGFYRRDFLKLGGAGLLGLSLADLLRLEAHAGEAKSKAKAKAVIMVWLAGGPATIDMWDLKPEAPEGIRGSFKPADTSASGIQISEHLPKMAKVIDRSTVVRSLAHTIPSHGPATVFMTTGNKPTPALQYPALGSLTSKLLKTEKGVPAYVAFNEIRGGTGAQRAISAQPTALSSSSDRPAAKAISPCAACSCHRTSASMTWPIAISSSRASTAASATSIAMPTSSMASTPSTSKRWKYCARTRRKKRSTSRPRRQRPAKPTALRRSARAPFAARRLVESGVRFVTLSLGGWDTHGKNFDALKTRLLPQLDQTLAALIGDLSDRGMLDDTIVYCAGEFGRTPKINKNDGRDHWARSMAVLLAGGGFKRGYVHGTTDAQGMAPATDPCTPDDVAATIFHNLGIDPHTELSTSTGRPIQLFREGHVIEKLLA